MRPFFLVLAIMVVLSSCTSADDTAAAGAFFVKAADVSSVPQVRQSGAIVKDAAGQPVDMLHALRAAGVNTVRLRIWNDPSTGYSSLAEVKSLAQEARSAGMKVWLTVHYSDTWADPGRQQKPMAWVALSYSSLKLAVYSYTAGIMQEVAPDYIQIGNEINNGFLWPEGSSANMSQFRELLAQGIRAVRDNSSSCKVILHYAGHEQAPEFYQNMQGLDYDLIGLSYYPLWHGKDLNALRQHVEELGRNYDKEILLAETAYPFTLGWNDMTGNIVGSSSQILPQYPATAQGQKDYIMYIRQLVEESGYGAGFCYWGGELIAFNGPLAENGSTFENMAFWDFQGNALPVLQAFSH